MQDVTVKKKSYLMAKMVKQGSDYMEIHYQKQIHFWQGLMSEVIYFFSFD